MMRITPNNIQELKPNEVFVFGSNKDGLHYGGAAKLAYDKFGAVMRQSFGLQGQSFGINTMGGQLDMIIDITKFKLFTLENKHLTFLVTEIGCGIAGFEPKDIAHLFADCLEEDNIYLPQRFIDYLKQIE